MADEKPKRDSKKEVAKFMKLHGQAEKIADTNNLEFSEYYNTAARAVLFDKENKVIDYSLLDKEEHRNKFADTLISAMEKAAIESLGGKYDKNNTLKNASATQGVYQIARDFLTEKINSHGSEYTQETHESYKADLVKKIRGFLTKNSHAHLSDSDKSELITKIPDIEKSVDTKKMTLREIVDMYISSKKNKGTPTSEQLRHSYKKAGETAPVYILDTKKDDKGYKKAS